MVEQQYYTMKGAAAKIGMTRLGLARRLRREGQSLPRHGGAYLLSEEFVGALRPTRPGQPRKDSRPQPAAK